MNFRIRSLPAAISSAARTTMLSPQYGHPVHTEIARGYGPCRSCLRQFRTGEENRLLLTYNPFDGIDVYPSPGPIFIHEAACEPYASDAFPPELRALPLMFEAYGESRKCIAMERSTPHAIEDQITRLLSSPGVRYVHVRNAEAGCFIASVTHPVA